MANNYIQIRRYGKAAKVEIEDWWLSVEIINHVLGATLWTWDDQLNLSASYKEAFYERDFDEQFIDRWEESLRGRRASGVEEQVISTDIAAMVPCGERGQNWTRRAIGLLTRLFCY